MGYYIETTSPHNKAATILARVPGTHVVQGTPRWEDLPEGKAYVCVVDNRIFEAAAFVYNESEYVAFTLPEDHRLKTWLTMDRADAERLSGYQKTFSDYRPVI